jgi:hypothetical protein
MPSSKKPRKKYTPKPKLLPLNVKREWEAELPLHLAWDALGTGDLDFHHVSEFLVHAELIHKVSPFPEMRVLAMQLYHVCEGILQRYQAVGRLGVSGPEMVTIRKILEITIPHSRTLPNDVIHKALKGGK